MADVSRLGSDVLDVIKVVKGGYFYLRTMPHFKMMVVFLCFKKLGSHVYLNDETLPCSN